MGDFDCCPGFACDTYTKKGAFDDSRRVAAEEVATHQSANSTSTCKAEDVTCVPLDFDCCPGFACDTYTKKCAFDHGRRVEAEEVATQESANSASMCKAEDVTCVPLDF